MGELNTRDAGEEDNGPTAAAVEVTILSANLGQGFGAQAGAPVRDDWLAEVARHGHQVLFLQEMPRTPEWGEQLATHGWQLHMSSGKTYPCRSGVAVPSSWRATAVHLPNEDYHGTYLAAVDAHVPGLGEVRFVSIHASPTPLTSADHHAWTGQLPPGRRPSPGAPAVWHSDQVLADIGAAAQAPMLVAGDLNEARRWDEVHGGSFGADWFRNAGELGFQDLVHPVWGEEHPTRGEYQIDHVLGTADVECVAADFGPEPWSDHRSLSVRVRVGRP